MAAKQIKETKPTKNSLDEMLLWETFGLQMRSGVPVLQAVNIVRNTFPAYETEFCAVHDAIKEGENISSTLEKYASSFHSNISELILVGEETGSLPEMCTKASEIIRREIALKKVGCKTSSDEYKKAVFYMNLQAILDAGMPLVRTMRDLSKNTSYLPKSVVTALADYMVRGYTFSESLDKQPKYFSNFETNMIRAGEASGALEVVTGKMANYFENKLKCSKVSGKNEKPKKNSLDEMLLWETFGTMIQSGVAVLQSLDIVGAIFPAYQKEFEAVNDAVREGDSLHAPLEKYASAFHAIMPHLIQSGEETGSLPEVCMLGSQLIGREYNLVNSCSKSDSSQKALFYMNLQALIDAGFPLVRALNVLKKDTSYLPKKVVAKMATDLMNGATLSEAVGSQSKYFSDFETHMIRAGECSGALGIVTGRMADYFALKAKYSAKKK